MGYYSRHLNLEGMQFGRLRVLHFEGTTDGGLALWKVRCSCGVEFISVGTNLRSGSTRSCGCLRKELLRERNHQRLKYENKSI